MRSILSSIDHLLSRPEGKRVRQALCALAQGHEGISQGRHRHDGDANKEYLVAIRPKVTCLHLKQCSSQTRSARPPQEFAPGIPDDADITTGEVSMAHVLIDSIGERVGSGAVHDTHRQKVEALIEEKSQGQDHRHCEVCAGSQDSVDLMEALASQYQFKPVESHDASKRGESIKDRAAKKAPAKRAASSTAKKAPASKTVRRKHPDQRAEGYR